MLTTGITVVEDRPVLLFLDVYNNKLWPAKCKHSSSVRVHFVCVYFGALNKRVLHHKST